MLFRETTEEDSNFVYPIVMTTIVYDVMKQVYHQKMGPCLSKKHSRVYATNYGDQGINRRGVRQFLNRLFGRFRTNTVLPAVVPGVGPMNTASVCNLTLEIFFDETVGEILGESSSVPANILSKYTAGSNSDASSCNLPLSKASSQTSASCMSVMGKAELARRLGKPIRGIEAPYSDRPVGAYRPTGNVKVPRPKVLSLQAQRQLTSQKNKPR